MPIILHGRHPNRLKISRATISHRVDAVTKRSLTSVGVSSDHIRINAVALKITCKKWNVRCSVKNEIISAVLDCP